MGIGGVVFISVAGIVADIHWQMPFLIYLFSIPVLILGVIYIYEPEITSKKDKSNESIKYNKKLAAIIYLLLFTGIIFFYMVPVQIPFLLGKLDNISNSKIGYAISLATLSSAIVSMNYKRIKRVLSFRQILQFALIIMGIGYFIISQSASYSSILAGLFVSGIGIGLLMPTGNLWIMSIAPEKIRGTLVGRLSMATFLGQFVSPIILQPIINSYNLNNSFVIAGICMWAISILMFTIKSKM